MNDIAASAERRAEVLLKNAELEASLITKEARESIAKLTEEGSRLKTKVETLKSRYKRLLEDELERLTYSGNDLFAEFENEFMPEPSVQSDRGEGAAEEKTGQETSKQDLSKTIVNLR